MRHAPAERGGTNPSALLDCRGGHPRRDRRAIYRNVRLRSVLRAAFDARQHVRRVNDSGVGAAATEELISGAVLREEAVVAFLTEKGVVAVSAFETVAARSAVEQVVARVTVESIGPRAAEQPV